MPSARWTMIILCCLANTINYIDRANLAVAAPIIQRELGFDSATIGFILGGFFWTYAVMQLPFGWFADRVGARIALAVAVVWWSIFTILTAVARGFASLLGCRLLLGVGEAGAYPSMAKVAANWFPDIAGKRIGTIRRLVIEKVSGHVVYAVTAFGGSLGVGAEIHTIPWE